MKLQCICNIYLILIYAISSDEIRKYEWYYSCALIDAILKHVCLIYDYHLDVAKPFLNRHVKLILSKHDVKYS
jgi:hypothetical protein